MPPVVIDVARADDVRDVVHRAVQALAEGKIVALPTETVYGLGAAVTVPGAVQRLAEAKGRDAAKSPFAIAIKGYEEAVDFVPNWSPLAQRIARRSWPGPVTLVVEADHERGLTRQFDQATRDLLCPTGTIGLRTPANRVIQDILRMLAGPIALTSVNLTGESDATTAQQCLGLGDKVSLVIDDGPARYGQASSVVKVSGDEYKILREGVVSATTLSRLARYQVVLVCTGNTCRSPLAEGLMRRKLATLLGCDDAELEERGVLVASAGVSACSGAPASPETVEVLHELGVDLRGHQSQPLTEQLVRHADLLLTLTRSHRQAIVSNFPDASERTMLLHPSGRDIADPIGGPLEVYRACAAEIAEGIEHYALRILAEAKVSK